MNAYKIGFLMDPYETLNLVTETSLLLMDELMARGHAVYWVEQDQLSLLNDRLSGSLTRVESTDPFAQSATGRVTLDVLDALMIRKDPPFDKSYLHLTYLLDFMPPHVLQINSPAALRDINEKLFTLKWAGHCPDTLVSRDAMTLMNFVERHGKVVLKPLDECSGRGIRFVSIDDRDIARESIRTMLGTEGYIMAQQFLPEVKAGDKRVYLVDGAPVAWVNRVPAEGKDLANIHQGASCEVTELTPLEWHISELVGSDLTTRGIVLAGLDFIGEKLTEVNVTSPSAVRQINAVTGSRVERRIVDAIVAHIDRHRSPDVAAHGLIVS